MIKSLCFVVMSFACFCIVGGCSSSEPSSVVEGTDLTAIQEYEANMKAEEEAANGSMQESVE